MISIGYLVVFSLIVSSIHSLKSSDVCTLSPSSGCKRSQKCDRALKCEGLHNFKCGKMYCALDTESCSDLLNINSMLKIIKT